ncbi:MAG TPA: ester cyclase, partial [Armatimonadota bacterium]|nr:ester cyclase [Armatimonadota bacterium]
EEVWNQKRSEVIDEMWAPCAVAHGLGEAGQDLSGVEGFKALHRKFLSAFPDLHIEVDDVVAEGDRTAARYTCTGTHQGGTLGIPATGRRVRFTGMSFTVWKDGRIVEGWNNVDFASMLQQLQG